MCEKKVHLHVFVVLMILLFFVADFHTVVVLILLFLLVVFLVYGLRTLNRQYTVLELDGEGLRANGLLRRNMLWEDITKFDLRYFSTRRDRQQGWMQLRLDSNDTVIRVDSQIEGFDRVVEQAFENAQAAGAAMGETTMINLASMGLGPMDKPSPEGGALAQ